MWISFSPALVNAKTTTHHKWKGRPHALDINRSQDFLEQCEKIYYNTELN